MTSKDDGALKPSKRSWPILNAASVLPFSITWSVNTRTMSVDRRGGSRRMEIVAEQVFDVHSKAYISPCRSDLRLFSSFLATSSLHGECTRWCNGFSALGHDAIPSFEV